MFSTTRSPAMGSTVETTRLVHTGCGAESSMILGVFGLYPQSTAPTTTTTLLNL